MAEEEDEENKVPKVDPIVFLRDWFKTRVLSSLKCKEDLVNGLLDKGSRAPRRSTRSGRRARCSG